MLLVFVLSATIAPALLALVVVVGVMPLRVVVGVGCLLARRPGSVRGPEGLGGHAVRP